MGTVTFGSLFRKYGAAVLFPTVLFSFIIADFRRTQKWKASLPNQNQVQYN